MDINELRLLVDKTKASAEKISVLLIFSHIKDCSDIESLTKVSFAERCYNDFQIDEFKNALIEFGFHVKTYRSEAEFLKDTVLGLKNQNFREYKIALYLGLGGIGPAKRVMIPSYCKFAGIPCCNTPASGMVMSWHRFFQTQILKAAGIPHPNLWEYHFASGWRTNSNPEDGTKIIVKSAYECCSVGVTENSVRYVDSSLEKYVYSISKEISQPIVVQEFISGKECYQPILEVQELHLPTPIEVRPNIKKFPKRNFLLPTDHETSDGILYSAPNDLNIEVIKRLQRTARKIHSLLELSVVSRIDFRITEDGTPYVFDIAENPGLNRFTSAFPKSFMLEGIEYTDLLGAIIGANLWRENIMAIHESAKRIS
ncbi:hypothetical protein [Desulfovibrio gilichinskyi]|uniref:D-alanine-D-alanine ligase n=1 Tax=Desulfovibrio gilichinskyi TaxID=1519643 RepID=A0A1X7F2Z2_9BACT|nr:hypothetical protein [Desulfovibrio gilichinskyi]SMF44358.1 D-alanine-D-alanine ligase [Desulfovibrio gilichinskyi]